ncbi:MULTISPECIES: DUF5319 domain-containing protein [Corynebacterium]|nr:MULTISPECIES: DUF5319 domain-containing protein [Corynebacterium]QNP91913.1 DUF5319 domain-containing protein [Corynebacterium zhongnanshanii]
MNFNDRMPPDPFADDPNDPASFLEPDEDNIPVTEEEKVGLRQDLKFVREFRKLLEPRHVRGITMFCEECDEPHFYDWNIIESNITLMLEDQPMPVHEPLVQPNPHDYVTWDYCLGYTDAAEYYTRGTHLKFPW